jgi:hypothetical protein
MLFVNWFNGESMVKTIKCDYLISSSSHSLRDLHVAAQLPFVCRIPFKQNCHKS